MPSRLARDDDHVPVLFVRKRKNTGTILRSSLESAKRATAFATPLCDHKLSDHLELEEEPLPRKASKEPTKMEIGAVETIKSLRAAHGPRDGDIGPRAEFLYELLQRTNGNAKLHLNVLYRELGCTERSMERKFLTRYEVTAHAFQENTRIAYAKRVMEMNPNIKITALASELGYDRESEFRRFFRGKEGMCPRDFRKLMKQAAEAEGRKRKFLK